MANVLVVSGGELQIPIIKKAKELGHYVVCSNLYEDSIGFAYADAGEVSDVLDKEKNLEIAKKYNIDFVVTDQSDIAVPTVAYVSERLGLKGIGTKIAERFTNKYLMRKIAGEKGFCIPDFVKCISYNEAKVFAEKHRKSIIKPVNSQGSRGIYTILCEEDFEEKFKKAMSYAHDDKAVIIEEYIDGTEFTVDGLKIENRYDILAISEKKHYKHNKNVASEMLFSNNSSVYDYNELKKVNRDLVFAMELPFGMTHAEYKYSDGKFYLIEIAARGGGARISSDIVPVMSGINSNEIFLRYMNDEKPEYNIKNFDDKYVILKFFDFKCGKVKKVIGLDDVKNWDNVIDIQIKLSQGDIISTPENDSLRLGYYIATAESKEEIDILCNKIEQTVWIEYEK